MLVGLRSMKRLRGTWADPFGRTEVRRTERRADHRATSPSLDRLLPRLAADRDECARESPAWSTWSAATSRREAAQRGRLPPALADAGY